MKKYWLLRAFLGVFLLSLVGCAGTKPAALPDQGEMKGQGNADSHVIAKGDKAKVTNTRGETIQGEVLRVSSTSIKIGRAGNYGYEETDFASGEVKSIEYVEDGPGWPLILGAVVLVVAYTGYQWSNIN